MQSMERQFAKLGHGYIIRIIGFSIEGRPLYTVTKPAPGRPKVHMNATVHGSERVTTDVLMGWLIAIQDESLPVELVIMPLVNPDGVLRKWKANARGVDLNDQFPAFWDEERQRRGIFEPGPLNYGGEAPLTEPEAIALYKLTMSQSFAMVVSIHAHGGELYYNYRGYEPANARQLAHYICEHTDYVPVELDGSDAGYKDWFIYTTGRPGFTLELMMDEDGRQVYPMLNRVVELAGRIG